MILDVQWKGNGFRYWVLIGTSPIDPRSTSEKRGEVASGVTHSDGQVHVEVAAGGLYSVVLGSDDGDTIAANNVASDSVLVVSVKAG